MESINRPELVKEHNLRLVRETLFQRKRATRQQLSDLTGISTVTLGALLQQLVESGQALELEKARSPAGRPARVYAFNARQGYGLLVYAAFERTGYYLHSALIDLYGETVWADRAPASPLDKTATLRYFDRLLHLRGTVRAVGIGLPGVGFHDYLHKNWNPDFLSLAALEELRDSAGLPVLLENDVNLAALGYARRKEVPPEETLVYLYLMKGSYGGSAIYLNGGLHLGKDRFAGDIISVPGGTRWFEMDPEDREALRENLLSTALPYLTILAPHRLAVASDYIRQEDLDDLSAGAARLLEGHCPEFSLAPGFLRDYENGLKELVLEKLREQNDRKDDL